VAKLNTSLNIPSILVWSQQVASMPGTNLKVILYPCLQSKCCWYLTVNFFPARFILHTVKSHIFLLLLSFRFTDKNNWTSRKAILSGYQCTWVVHPFGAVLAPTLALPLEALGR
jgi:hypothetical protein